MHKIQSHGVRTYVASELLNELISIYSLFFIGEMNDFCINAFIHIQQITNVHCVLCTSDQHNFKLELNTEHYIAVCLCLCLPACSPANLVCIRKRCYRFLVLFSVEWKQFRAKWKIKEELKKERKTTQKRRHRSFRKKMKNRKSEKE